MCPLLEGSIYILYIIFRIIIFSAIQFQLKLYAQKQSANPEIDDTYSAKGGNGDTWKKRLDSDTNIAKVIICAQIFIAIFAVIIIALIVSVRLVPKFLNSETLSDSKCCTTTDDKSKTCICKDNLLCICPLCICPCYKKYIKYGNPLSCTGASLEKYAKFLYSHETMPLIFSTAVISILFCLYTLSLDVAAVYYRNDMYNKFLDLRVLYSTDDIGKPYSILYNLPVVVLVFDTVSTAIWFIVVFVSLIIVISCPHLDDKMKPGYFAFSLLTSIICAVFVIFIHFPYIAIAFLNDAYHAGSMFIYYSIVTFTLFVLVEVVYKSNIKCRLVCFSQLKEEEQYFCSRKLCIAASMTFLIGLIVLFFGFIVTVTCYFVIIPINMSISDAPNRLIGIYQSGVIVIAAIVLYKTFIKKGRNPFKRAIKETKTFEFGKASNENWKNLSEEEKEVVFYTKVIAIVDEHLKN